MRLGSLELPSPHAIMIWLALDREREVEEELGEGGKEGGWLRLSAPVEAT